jgi:hypothetical protein
MFSGSVFPAPEILAVAMPGFQGRAFFCYTRNDPVIKEALTLKETEKSIYY